MATSFASWSRKIPPSSTSPSGPSCSCSSREVRFGVESSPSRSLTLSSSLIEDPTLENQIRSSKDLIPLATHLSTLSSGESQDGEASHTEGSEDGEADGGESEIRVLARTVLDLLEGN